MSFRLFLRDTGWIYAAAINVIATGILELSCGREATLPMASPVQLSKRNVKTDLEPLTTSMNVLVRSRPALS